jgi:hypothetical protein
MQCITSLEKLPKNLAIDRVVGDIIFVGMFKWA